LAGLVVFVLVMFCFCLVHIRTILASLKRKPEPDDEDIGG
jgi:hypothetical protein